MSLSNREHARLRAVNRMMSRGSGKRIAVVVAGLAAVPLLAGCFNGFDAQTSNQPPSEHPNPQGRVGAEPVQRDVVRVECDVREHGQHA